VAPTPFDLLHALARLTRRLTEEHTATLLPDALDLLLSGSGCVYGAVYLVDQQLTPMALRLPSGGAGPDSVRQTVDALAAEVVALQKRRVVPDLLAATPPIPGAAITALAAQGALALPIEHARVAVGAVVLLPTEEPALDAERIAFVEAATHTIGLAVHRDRGAELERIRREEIEESNRMASIGLLTGSVAHELRGPVAALVLQLGEQRRLLQEAATPGADSTTLVSELAELTADLDTAVGRVRGILDQLGRLSRRDSQPAELDLAGVVRDAMETVRPYLRRRGIEVSEHLETSTQTTGRRDNLAQVLLNLVLNAADACEQAPAGSRTIRVSVAPDADRAVLQVDDSGPGIPPDAVRTIFTPFYTTKQRGKGTGLGLKICADVVTAHGGHIEVANRPQGGASFRVILPRHGATASTPPPGAARPSAPPPPARILVIDDDPLFLRAVRRGLKEITVDTALTASEAEIRFALPDYQPDLVLCDLHLPGLNGHTLHARIAARDPTLAARFVFCTGGALSPEEAAYLRDSGCPTLFKPLNLDDVRAMLEEPSESWHHARTLARASSPPERGGTA